MKKPDIAAGFLALALATYVFFETAHFPPDSVLLLGPAFFPRLLAGGLGTLAAALIGMALAGRSSSTGPEFDFAGGGMRRALLALVGAGVYTLLLPGLGFVPASILFLIYLMVLLQLKNYVKVLGVSIAVTAAVFFVFHTVLKIALPLGLLAR
ncbi:MAG TPA: tripartite tricarboxylate transporter TctB family protein [Firmicutes bacterium]|nr:tripartite tricarboxylate transporter TctB family protein [Bacillota bacterium]